MQSKRKSIAFSLESRANVRYGDKQTPSPIGNEMTSGGDGVFALVSLGA